MVAEGGKLAGEGADDVVGFETFVEEDGDAESFEGSANVGMLLNKVGRRGCAVGLVAAVYGGFEFLSFNVELLDVLHLAG